MSGHSETAMGQGPDRLHHPGGAGCQPAIVAKAGSESDVAFVEEYRIGEDRNRDFVP